MRIVSWNMGCGSPRFTKRYRTAQDEAWRLLLGLNPDVVLLQESLLQLPSWVYEQGGAFMQPKDYESQDSGVGVFVPGNARGASIPLAIAGSYVVAAEVTAGAEAPVFVASLHVDTNNQRANLEAIIETLAPMLASRTFVIGGDFNAARGYDTVYKRNVYSWFFAALADRGFHDCHFGLHQNEVQSFWGHQAKHAYQLDHFFVGTSQAAAVRACSVVDNPDTRRLSDHGPIVLELG